MSTELMVDKVPKSERAKSIGPRLFKAIEALVVGERCTIKDAAAFAGLTREALSKALAKPHVQAHMRKRIQQVLRVGAAVAGNRMVELLHSPNEMVGFNASRFLLATGAGIAPPTQPMVAVNVGLPVGYVIDTSRRRRGPVDATPVMLEAEAIEVTPHRLNYGNTSEPIEE
jgi:hypothetical protein